MSNQDQTPINTFASLHWYDETIKFTFNFVAKTSELLLAAGVVVSSANFLTDGAVMQHHSPLAVAWAWAQALAIDSSLGIVFVHGFQAARERDGVKAAIYFTLTAMLAAVAGLLTHFDALSHATGLPVTDKSISGVIPLWILTALRALAVIGYLLVSRIKNTPFSRLQEPAREPEPGPESQLAPVDYTRLATAIVEMMQQRVKFESITIGDEEAALLPLLQLTTRLKATQAPEPARPVRPREIHRQSQEEEMEVDRRIARAYEEIRTERENTGNSKRISARELASRAFARRSTCSAWLQRHGTIQENEGGSEDNVGETYA